MTITEFLLARIAEDDADATAVIRANDDGTWSAGDGSPTEVVSRTSIRTVPAATLVYTVATTNGGRQREAAAHIARHDPARVLAECAAKRRIVEQAGAYRDEDEIWWLLPVLAAIYADHPDYDVAWRP